MNEFFASSTSNQRKRDIEELLNNFSSQQGAWQQCFYFLGHTRNEYVLMYTLSVFENLINRQWVGLQPAHKLEIRDGLTKFLLTNHKSMQLSIRNKLVKVIVCIGRLDWPHFYPDFFNNIIQLIQQPATTSMGLQMLLTASEELASPREDLSAARKEELRQLLEDQIPTIFGIITHILETILDKHRQLVTTSTPPPSPTHGDNEDGSPSHATYGSSPLQSGSHLIRTMFKSPPSNKQNLLPLPPLDQESELLTSMCLNCLSHFFSWMPLSTNISSSLLTVIFHLANFGCEIHSVHQGTSPSKADSSFSTSGSSSIGVLAMNCINEIVAKNCVPMDFEEFLLKMFQQTFQLLQKLTKDTTSQSVGNQLAELDTSYVEKFTDFLRLFVSIHLRRFESNSNFPVVEFLALLFKYTFKQPTEEGFYNCLEVWTIFLEYLLDKVQAARHQESNHIIDRYRDALVSVMNEVLRKMQFCFNQSQLEEMDDEILDDDEETEWQHFLRQCLEVVAKIAELLPTEAFGLLYPVFQENLDVYLGLGQFVIDSSEGRKLNIAAENECRKLHCTLRDLSTLLQALGRLADHFIAEKFVSRFENALSLVERFCQAAVYGSSSKLFWVKTAVPTVLQPDLCEVHAHVLAALQAYSHWLAQFYNETQRQGATQGKFLPLLTNIVEAIEPLLAKHVPPKIVQAAAHLFLSLSATVRPTFLVELSQVQKMFNDVSRGSMTSHPTEVQLIVCRALSNILILPWPNIPEREQQWSARSENHLGFIRRITSEYRALKTMPNLSKDKALQARAKPTIHKTLHLLSDQVESIAGEVSKTKQVCYHSLQESIQVTLHLFPIYIHQPDVVEDMMGFYLALFQGLRVQMGIPSIQNTISIFVNLFTRDQLAETIAHESTAGTRVVEKFLHILEIIIQEPGSAFKAFIPNIISICMDHIYPIIAERASPDIKPALYQLLFELLQNKWRYFFPSSVLNKVQGESDLVENDQQFIAIMQAFGQSFLQPDISVFRQNMAALELLNSKFKLYHKKIFKDMMLFPFLNVLQQVLLARTHDLLQEEITLMIYNMASVDMSQYFSRFIGEFLSSSDGLHENQREVLMRNFKNDVDLPSFTQNFQRFVNDLRYYRLCNNALPEGSVKL